MSAQLGSAETGGEVLNFSELEKSKKSSNSEKTDFRDSADALK